MAHNRALVVRFCSVLLAASTISCTPSEEQVAGMAAQAQQLLEAGQPAQAQELIGRAVRTRDDLPQVFLVQARIAMTLGRRGDAYGAYANALALEATNPEALQGVAQTGLGSGHLEEADDAADKILVLDPGQTDAMLVKGIVKMVRNDLDGTIAFTDRILALKPDDMGAIILKSRALALRGDRTAATALLDSGIARLGPTLELTMARAELQRQGGDAEAFLASLRRIRELAPVNRDARFDLVDTLYRLGQVDEARAETLSLIEDASGDAHEASRYARLWYAYDREGLTAEQLARVGAKASVETRLALARFYMATARARVAAALLRPVATGWSGDIQAAYARATGTGSAVPAILERDSENGDALLMRAGATLARGDPTGAVIDYQRVVRDYPEWEEGYVGLARAYLASDKADGARRAFESGRQALPQSLPLARAYIAMLLQLGDRVHAQEVARRFALNSPSLIAAWTLYGDICGRTGGGDCRDEAIAGLERAGAQFGLDLALARRPGCADRAAELTAAASVSAGKVRFLDLPIARLRFGEVVDAVFARADADAFSYVVTPNVDHVVRLDRLRGEPVGEAFAASYNAAALVLCDSRILKRLARWSGYDLSLVPGSDLTRELLNNPRVAGRTIAVVGGRATLLPALERRVPGVRFVQHRPPMNVLRDEAAMAAIEAFVATTRADLVFLAIGAPQSEIAAHRCLTAGRARGVGLCVGASLEFIVGDKRRAPPWMQRAGLEWAFRLGSEPRRLWRRYLIEGPRIFAIWARHR